MNKSIILIAPEAPPFGGMANQARLLASCLAKEGVQVFFVPTNKPPDIGIPWLWSLPVFRTIGNFMSFVWGMLRHIRHCDGVHIFACSHAYFFINVVPALIMGRLFKKRILLNYRGGEAEIFFKGFARHFLPVFKLADAMVVPSGFLKTVFQNLGIPSVIIPNIAEISRFHFKRPDYGKENVRFICTRNFEAYYDVMTLVRAFQIVKMALPKASLTLIGDGSLKQALMDAVNDKGLAESVLFLGKIDPHDMPGCLSRSDIFVNSSVVDNYPISLLEAFSCGLPVVSTDAGGIPFLVENGVTGLLVPVKDEKALAREMIRLAEDPDLGQLLAENAGKVADEHSWERIGPRLKSEYGW